MLDALGNFIANLVPMVNAPGAKEDSSSLADLGNRKTKAPEIGIGFSTTNARDREFTLVSESSDEPRCAFLKCGRSM